MFGYQNQQNLVTNKLAQDEGDRKGESKVKADFQVSDLDDQVVGVSIYRNIYREYIMKISIKYLI